MRTGHYPSRMEKRPNHAGLDPKEMTGLRRYTVFFTAGAGVLGILCLLVFLYEDGPVRYFGLVGLLAAAFLVAVLTYVLVVGRRVE